jgi:hypothetical protein
MGLNQRQAAGKFTAEEAAAFIERLQSGEVAEAVSEAPGPPARLFSTDTVLRGIPSEQLAAELRRRGWVVIEA